MPDPWGSMSMDKTSPKTSQEGPSSSKIRETTDWFVSLKPSCTDTFSHDSDPIKEARSHYFATHPFDWIHDNTDDLSDIFRELAEGAGLLGKSIYEIQLSWDGPRGVKACQLFSLITAQRVKVPKGGTHHGIPKGHGTQGDP